MAENNPTPLNPYPDHPDLARAYITKGRKTFCVVAAEPSPAKTPNPDNPTTPTIEGATLCGKPLEHLSFDSVRGLHRLGLDMHDACETIFDNYLTPDEVDDDE